MARQQRLISKRAYDALRRSYEHWCELEEVTDVDELYSKGFGAQACALCRLYNPMLTDTVRRVCSKKCPIAYDEDTSFCEGTPHEAMDKWSRRAQWKECGVSRVPRKKIEDMSMYLFKTLVNVRYK